MNKSNKELYKSTPKVSDQHANQKIGKNNTVWKLVKIDNKCANNANRKQKIINPLKKGVSR